jgi:hypothetical protein
MAGHGLAWAANSSAGGFGLLRCSFGSSPGETRRCLAKHGSAGHGRAWQCVAMQGPQTVARRACGPSLPSSRMVMAWPVWAWHGAAQCGAAMLGDVRQGLRQQHGGLRLSLLLSLEGSQGAARRGTVGLGAVDPSWSGFGRVRADDLSTEPFGALCWVLWNPVMAGRGLARHVLPRCGDARHGLARHGLTNSARRAAALRAEFTENH